MFNLGMPELLVILVIALVVFGPAKLPEIGRSFGKGLKEFRSATTDVKDEVNRTATPEVTAGKEQPK